MWDAYTTCMICYHVYSILQGSKGGHVCLSVCSHRARPSLHPLPPSSPKVRFLVLSEVPNNWPALVTQAPCHSPLPLPPPSPCYSSCRRPLLTSSPAVLKVLSPCCEPHSPPTCVTDLSCCCCCCCCLKSCIHGCCQLLPPVPRVNFNP